MYEVTRHVHSTVIIGFHREGGNHRKKHFYLSLSCLIINIHSAKASFTRSRVDNYEKKSFIIYTIGFGSREEGGRTLPFKLIFKVY